MTGRPTQPLSRPALVAGMVVLYLGWGSTYPAMRIALRTIPPFLLLGARCAAAGVVLLAAARLRKAPVPTAAQWRGAAVVGLLTLGLGHGLTTFGVGRVPGGTAALLVSMTAVWIAVLAWWLLGERPRRRGRAGLVVAFAGLFAVVGTDVAGSYDSSAVAALLLAPLFWAVGSVVSRKVVLPDDVLMATAAQLLTAALLPLSVGVATGEIGSLGRSTFVAESVWAFAYLTVCGYVVVFSAYTHLIGRAPMSTVGTYAYVNPVVAAVLGVLVLGEPLTSSMVVGGAVILVGVAMVVVDGARARSVVLTLPEPSAPGVTRPKVQPAVDPSPVPVRAREGP